MARLFYMKHLTSSDVTNILAIETDHLEDFPPFPHGQHFQNLRFLDEECNIEWNFCLTVRQTGSYLKPTIGGGWIQFCKMRGLQEGHIILFFQERDEATGQFKYKIRPFYNFL
ncbi:hypothetical protein Pint_19113 [Pistacia integerrima]|uniref:Uncharacterized protein n=2 Tax=Pistacia TaxID=55512 RepID=A0ACC1BJ79_9ROSI|nr:hypothetical protein Pint_19113 [Pistacia integerrima]KAJ0098916.1 hypothetical protein Patl1_21798 [Pistacia atlantica]